MGALGALRGSEPLDEDENLGFGTHSGMQLISGVGMFC